MAYFNRHTDRGWNPLHKRLSRGASPAERTAEHSTRMMERKLSRLQDSHGGRVRHYRVAANLSAFHPDFGETPQEHERRKALRAAGKVPFVPKEERRARLGKLR